CYDSSGLTSLWFVFRFATKSYHREPSARYFNQSVECLNLWHDTLTAMDALTMAAAAREKEAAKAMRGATTAAAQHTGNAKKMQALPSAAPEKQCAVVYVEQIKYVQSRHPND
nr:hypothetical protein [Nitrosospira sp.]